MSIINHLETYGRFTYENEALGCFLNFIKEEDDIMGKEKQEFLSYILDEYNLMEPIAKSSGIPKWKGKSNEEDIKEEIIGEDTLRHVAFLQKGLEVTEAVVRVKAPFSLGTGFMITPDLLLTCHHVLNDAAKLPKTCFQFNYQEDFEGNAQEVQEFKAKEGGAFHCNEDLDYAVVEIDGSPGQDLKYLPLQPHRISKKERVNIIQHPAGMPKKISLQNNFVEYVDEKVVQYLTTTMKGSSGSPVCNDEWNVVALHHAGGMLEEPNTNRQYFRNEGILISAILKDLPAKIHEKLQS